MSCRTRPSITSLLLTLCYTVCHHNITSLHLLSQLTEKRRTSHHNQTTLIPHLSTTCTCRKLTGCYCLAYALLDAPQKTMICVDTHKEQNNSLRRSTWNRIDQIFNCIKPKRNPKLTNLCAHCGLSLTF
jgi:hypothetical protein